MIITTIRVDRVLYEKIIKQATKDDRSINSEIKYIIKQYLEMINWNIKR